MLVKILKISLSCIILVLSVSCILNIKLQPETFKIEKPLSILMYSPNYNDRPKKSKIESIIIHHTAPFYSLTRVGYYFQDINSRVSSHYIVGKEGLIIECVNDEKRSWHSGYSSWKGKFNVNDYSIGIEVLNNGDGKDNWTQSQYNSLAKLTAYLIKKYDIKLDNVIGHKDIALPLGRKIDPADNFDWNLFKNKVRYYLQMNISYFDQNPQVYNDKPNYLLEKLKSQNLKERISSINSFLTIKNREYISKIKNLFKEEKYTSVLPYYYRFFSIYKDNSFINDANEIINNYNKYPLKLFKASLEYLYENDKEGLYSKIKNLINKDVKEKYKLELFNFISYYNDNKEIVDILIDNYVSSKEKNIKISILQAMSNIKDSSIKLFLLNELKNTNLIEIKLNIVNALRINYDETVENVLINLTESEFNNELINSIANNLIRNRSTKGILKLQNERLFSVLDKQNKLALINMCGILKISESWLINNSKKEKDKELLSAYIIGISKFRTDEGFNYLFLNSYDDKEIEFTRIKALGYYNNKKIDDLIKNILLDKNSIFEYKILALSFINDRKMKNLLPFLRSIYVENRNSELESIIKETIEAIDNSSIDNIDKYLILNDINKTLITDLEYMI
jgi:N-acetylmuramoyl-L-alanine amidase